MEPTPRSGGVWGARWEYLYVLLGVLFIVASLFPAGALPFLWKVFLIVGVATLVLRETSVSH